MNTGQSRTHDVESALLCSSLFRPLLTADETSGRVGGEEGAVESIVMRKRNHRSGFVDAIEEEGSSPVKSSEIEGPVCVELDVICCSLQLYTLVVLCVKQ
jgi:hypothetical protein